MANSLSSSVSSLRSSLQLLESSIDILDEGVNDFPRLCKVLQSTRHFELLPEPTLHEAQKAIFDEISPSIAHLLTLASNHLDKLARREESLKAKCELQEGRLCRDTRLPSHIGGYTSIKTNVTPGSNTARAAELRKLVQKKERLKYAVEGLELQSRQRERQLRKSMAAQ
ncbi:DASH complex subunit spc19 [Ophidiomyces ophidiicola]|nr:DASH complex subunit spc19 [Ophidiomyces ophidiicola]